MVTALRDFNPPTPCGVGLDPLLSPVPIFVFQSTHPLRGGTAKEYKKSPVSFAQRLNFGRKHRSVDRVPGCQAANPPAFSGFSGANLPAISCVHDVRTKPSGLLRPGKLVLRRSVLFLFHTNYPGNKTEDCPGPHPLWKEAYAAAAYTEQHPEHTQKQNSALAARD